MKVPFDPRIFFLAIVTFAVGTDAFVIAGILPALAQDLHVSIEQAGEMVTVFALTYALGAPFLAVFTARVARRSLLIVVLLGLCLANMLSALAPAFGWMLLSRVLAALCASLCTPTALSIAATLASAEQRGKALASVNFGLTVATVLGVPIGTLIGHRFGWTWTFGFVATLAGVAALALAASLPAVPLPQVASLRARFAPFGQKNILLGLGVTFFWAVAAFTVYTFITPLLRENMHVKDVSGFLLIYGLAAMTGNMLGGFGADRWGTLRPTLTSLVLLSLIFLTLPETLHGLLSAPIALVLWGIAAWSLYPAQQARLLSFASEHSSVILALNGSIVYLGVAVGSALGGLVLAHTSVSALGITGGVIALLTLGLQLLSSTRIFTAVSPR